MRAVASKSNADVVAEYEAVLQNHTQGTLVSPLRFTEQTEARQQRTVDYSTKRRKGKLLTKGSTSAD